MEDENLFNITRLLVILLSLLVLVIKNISDDSQREWDIWCLDISKQAIGSTLGSTIDLMFRGTVHRKFVDGDECENFLMNHLYNVMLGTIFNVAAVSVLRHFVMKGPNLREFRDLLNFGFYGEIFTWKPYFLQLIAWIIIVMTGKLVFLLICLVMPSPKIGSVLKTVFSVLSKYPDVKMTIMILFMPAALSSFAAWIQDTFLKYDNHKVSENYLVGFSRFSYSELTFSVQELGQALLRTSNIDQNLNEE